MLGHPHAWRAVFCLSLAKFSLLKQHGIQYLLPAFSLLSTKPGDCDLYCPVFLSIWYLSSVNSKIYLPAGIVSAPGGITTSPSFAFIFSTSSCVKLTFFFKSQYRGHIYQYFLLCEDPYFIALSYEPAWFSSICFFSSSVKIIGCLLTFQGHDREYSLMFPVVFFGNKTGSSEYNLWKTGFGFDNFAPVMSRSIVPLWNNVTPSPDSSGADEALVLLAKLNPVTLILFFGADFGFGASFGVSSFSVSELNDGISAGAIGVPSSLELPPPLSILSPSLSPSSSSSSLPNSIFSITSPSSSSSSLSPSPSPSSCSSSPFPLPFPLLSPSPSSSSLPNSIFSITSPSSSPSSSGLTIGVTFCSFSTFCSILFGLALSLPDSSTSPTLFPSSSSSSSLPLPSPSLPKKRSSKSASSILCKSSGLEKFSKTNESSTGFVSAIIVLSVRTDLSPWTTNSFTSLISGCSFELNDLLHNFVICSPDTLVFGSDFL